MGGRFARGFLATHYLKRDAGVFHRDQFGLENPAVAIEQEDVLGGPHAQDAAHLVCLIPDEGDRLSDGQRHGDEETVHGKSTIGQRVWL